jgi:hypothetical protein
MSRVGRALVAVGLLCMGNHDQAARAAASTAAAAQTDQCLPGERGYLRASLRGAIESELDWRGALIQCEGGARPDGSGIRVSFLGPADVRGHRLRLVFGVAARPGAARSAAAGTNVTVIVEGENRVYATLGDERCAVDAMVQEPLPVANPAGPTDAGHLYRVAARGYCVDPATMLDGSGRLYINRFDFAGMARFEDNELHAATRN